MRVVPENVWEFLVEDIGNVGEIRTLPDVVGRDGEIASLLTFGFGVQACEEKGREEDCYWDKFGFFFGKYVHVLERLEEEEQNEL